MSYSWVSSKLAVGDDESLVTVIAAGVTAVVNVAAEIDDDPADLGTAEYTKVALVDESPGQTPNDCSLFQDALDAIYEYLRDGEIVYVHCNAGANRSPAMVALYYHEYRGHTLDGAVDFIETKHTDTNILATLWANISSCYPDDAEAECPSVECCPESPWQDNSSSIQAQLNGLMWDRACQQDMGGGHCLSPVPADQTVVLTGEQDKTYYVVLRIRGVVEEYSYYTSGTVVAGTDGHCYECAIGEGVPDPDPEAARNRYWLDISDPPKRYWLNRNTVGGLMTVDYDFTVKMRTGATLTLSMSDPDAIEVDNTAALEVTVEAGDPPLGVVQPYDGQFLVMNVVTIIS